MTNAENPSPSINGRLSEYAYPNPHREVGHAQQASKQCNDPARVQRYAKRAITISRPTWMAVTTRTRLAPSKKFVARRTPRKPAVEPAALRKMLKVPSIELRNERADCTAGCSAQAEESAWVPCSTSPSKGALRSCNGACCRSGTWTSAAR